MAQHREGILQGVRVIDFTDFLAGPYIGMYFADMGADVIKFENLKSHGNFVRNARPLEPKTGLSNHIDVALIDSIVSGMEAKLMQYVYTGESPAMTGNKYISSAPYDSFKAKDAWFVIASGTDKHFEVLSAAMGMPELARDPLYCDTELRKPNRSYNIAS